MYKIGFCIGALLVTIFFVWLQTVVVQYLWNWLVPLLWKTAPILDFWQTFGILVLLNIIGGILFKRGK